MIWEIDYDDEEQIVVLTLSGVVPGPEMLEAAEARIKAGREKNTTRFIIDAEDMIAPRSATMDVFSIPTQVYQKNKVDRKTRIAVITPRDPQSEWIAGFYDDLCTTRGWTVKIFADRPGALGWLRS